MMKLAVIVLVLSLLTLLSVAEQAEEEANDNQVYYQSIQHRSCFNTKIADENDDDGNSYFYNGAFRAAYQRYVTFNACTNSENCELYVTSLEDYVQTSVQYVQNYCNMCAQQCRRRLNDGRFLEDAEQEEEEEEEAEEADIYGVTCNTCKSACSYRNSGEVDYLQCQQLDAEDDNVAYYTAPQCENGNLVIGRFYDDECTIKAGKIDLGLGYGLFRSFESLEIDCSESDICNQLIGNDAVQCKYNQNGDNASLCKSAAHASRDIKYKRKNWYSFRGRNTGTLIVFFAVLSCAIAFLSYTYYIRHTSSRKVPMASLDETTPENGGQDGTQAVLT